MLPIIRLLWIPMLALVSSMAVAAEFNPKDFHASNCTRCHDDSVYIRDNRRVTSYPALQAQVERCDANLGTTLFPDDLALLVDHMNSTYYKFDK